MDNYLLSVIKNTTEYIEENLLEELNLDNISENVNISKFHLLRIWKGATGTGLMEYVRRRRIACSIKDLISEYNSIEFISSKYSFGCAHTYNRLFKEEFGTTPAKWRRHPSALSIMDRFNADFMSKAGEGLMSFLSITVLPAFKIAGYEFTIDREENNKKQLATQYGVDFFYNHRLQIANPVNKDIYIGYTTIPGKDAAFSYYQPSLMVDHNSILPPDMMTKKIKTHKYGVFKYMGPHRPEELSSSTLKAIWDYIYSTWMPTIEFELEELFHFEYVDYSKCNKQYCECELFYPISQI